MSTSELLATPMGFEPTNESGAFAGTEANTSPLRSDGSQTVVLRQGVSLRSNKLACPRCGGSAKTDRLDRDYRNCISCGPVFAGVIPDLDYLTDTVGRLRNLPQRRVTPRSATALAELADAMKVATE